MINFFLHQSVTFPSKQEHEKCLTLAKTNISSQRIHIFDIV